MTSRSLRLGGRCGDLGRTGTQRHRTRWCQVSDWAGRHQTRQRRVSWLGRDAIRRCGAKGARLGQDAIGCGNAKWAIGGGTPSDAVAPSRRWGQGRVRAGSSGRRCRPCPQSGHPVPPVPAGWPTAFQAAPRAPARFRSTRSARASRSRCSPGPRTGSSLRVLASRFTSTAGCRPRRGLAWPIGKSAIWITGCAILTAWGYRRRSRPSRPITWPRSMRWRRGWWRGCTWSVLLLLMTIGPVRAISTLSLSRPVVWLGTRSWPFGGFTGNWPGVIGSTLMGRMSRGRIWRVIRGSPGLGCMCLGGGG
ncbi:hypothetical protein CLV40_118118 [Actinokineospora auranticolor]|uniref:Uncharacterized protein n=1 Tax=Actinokineospora auranticolor TaxID=155976 RepID=A0A2S6GHM0_9PSEU|nr:hypothetical protein CLV40_118118 [Actinokineospora auranticolor]